MKREAFDHAVRAAGSVLGEDQVLVIGSQALHATVADHLPPEAERSVEADVAAFDDPDDRKADSSMDRSERPPCSTRPSATRPKAFRRRRRCYRPDGAIDWFDTNHRRRTESLPGVSTCTTCGCRRRSPCDRRTSSSALRWRRVDMSTQTHCRLGSARSPTSPMIVEPGCAASSRLPDRRVDRPTQRRRPLPGPVSGVVPVSLRCLALECDTPLRGWSNEFPAR